MRWPKRASLSEKWLRQSARLLTCQPYRYQKRKPIPTLAGSLCSVATTCPRPAHLRGNGSAGIPQKSDSSKTWDRVSLSSTKQTEAVAICACIVSTGTQIRANQGNSVEIDLELEPSPPAVLYHGTVAQFLLPATPALHTCINIDQVIALKRQWNCH